MQFAFKVVFSKNAKYNLIHENSWEAKSKTKILDKEIKNICQPRGD